MNNNIAFTTARFTHLFAHDCQIVTLAQNVNINSFPHLLVGDDLRKAFEKTITELTRSGKRRPITEWIKANYGGLAGLLKEEPSKFEMVGAANARLKEAVLCYGKEASSKPAPGTKMLCAEAEEEVGLNFAVDIV